MEMSKLEFTMQNGCKVSGKTSVSTTHVKAVINSSDKLVINGSDKVVINSSDKEVIKTV